MKKAEIILGISSIVALIMNLLLIPFGGFLTVLMLSSLSMIYFYLSFALFNNIRFRNISKKDSYKEVSKMRIIGAIATGIALTFLILGILFKAQSWPGARMYLGVGIFGMIVIFIVGAIKFSANKSSYYTKIFKRLAIFGILSLILFFLPGDAWMELKYRNHPAYIDAVKKAKADPGNQELWKKVEEERDKVHNLSKK